jgi:hypothetical protein
MNTTSSTAAVPPPIADAASNTPLGDLPEDRLPITGPITALEAMLRQPRRLLYQLRHGNARLVVASLCGIAVLSALVYGLVVGTFSGGTQLWAAPAKVTGGMLVSVLICLPSLFVFSCLAGSQARLVEVLGLVVGLLALTTILLIGFAPVAWVFSQSTSSVAVMGTLHLSFWTVATWFGWRFVRNGFTHLSARSGAALNVWFTIFVLVCLQMTTALRPLVGSADTLLPTEKRFFLAHWLNVLGDEEQPRTTRR